MKSITHKNYQNLKFIKRFGLKIYFQPDDRIPNTVDMAVKACEQRGLNWKLYSKIYYLRGWRDKTPYENVLLGCLEKGKRFPKDLLDLLDCLNFWNREGIKCHAMNANPGENYEAFILRCMACDCRVYVKPHEDKYITGNGGNHIWVAERQSGQRILIFHF